MKLESVIFSVAESVGVLMVADDAVRSVVDVPGLVGGRDVMDCCRCVLAILRALVSSVFGAGLTKTIQRNMIANDVGDQVANDFSGFIDDAPIGY